MKKLFTIDNSYHGRGSVLFAWQPEGNFLATSGQNGLVHIFDRHGKQVSEIPLATSNPCIKLDWDKDGEVLAVLQSGSGIVPLWDSNSRQSQNLDTNLKDPTFMAWSKVGPQLAIGTAKGNLLIYRKDNRKRIPVLGKHSRRIVCGSWSNDNRLALGAEDCTLTLSTAGGDTIEQTELKYEPHEIEFASQKSEAARRSQRQREANRALTGGRGAESKAAAHQDLPESTVSINMGGQTILLYNLEDPDHPIELAFQDRYGSIVRYSWFGDGYMMIGFSAGFLVVISTHKDEIGEELFSGKFHKEQLEDIAFSPSLQRAATCGDNSIKLVDMSDWKEVKSEAVYLEKNQGIVQRLGWTDDGQILTVSTANGAVINFLARMPTIHDSFETRIGYLSSLREISVVDAVDDMPPLNIPIALEPAFLALGPNHVAVGMNNRVWFHRAHPDNRDLVNTKEYPGTVSSLQLNGDYAAVLCDGKVHLHLIEPRNHEEEETLVLPAQDREEAAAAAAGGRHMVAEDNRRVTSARLTANFLIYSTARSGQGPTGGTVEFFSLQDWTPLAGCEFRHDTEGIRSVFPNTSGTRVVITTTSGQGMVYNPVDGHVLPIPGYPTAAAMTMWDPADWGVFVVADSSNFHTFVYSPLTINGPQMSKLGLLEVRDNGDMVMEPRPTRVPHGHTPVLVYNGRVTCQVANGTLADMRLDTHDLLSHHARQSAERLRQCFCQNLALLRLKPSWDVAAMLRSRPFWLALSGKAMEQLDIDMALRVYRELGDAGMVMGLQKIRAIEDKNLLAGHVAMLFADYSQAQELFLASCRPLAALEMRRDLLHWENALKLAHTLAPNEVPALSVEYAQQLEFTTEYANALQMYENALTGLDAADAARAEAESKAESKAAAVAGARSNSGNTDGGGGAPAAGSSEILRGQCRSGIARMTLRLGDLRRGLGLALDSGDRTLCRECAAILESLKQFPDAALLYERGEQYEKAASILIQTKNFDAARPLMDKIQSPQLHSQYARAKEGEGAYEEAAQAYERAHDLDAVIRLNLEHLSNPELAFALVRRTASSSGAMAVAAYCSEHREWSAAIEFLLLAKRSEEAFDLATRHDQMDTYAAILGESGGREEYLNIAHFYETIERWGKAGEFYMVCGKYHKALKLFLQCGESEMGNAIKVVGKARNDMLTHTLIDYLMGETDNVPKDPNYIFQLYMALGNYIQAAKTAIIIARQEQDLGNYKVAHNILFETYRDLRAQNIRVPQNLARALLLLHSYLLVKRLVRRGDHASAARMLVRVGNSISKFPSHIVPILTTAVIECQRARLKKTSFHFAKVMMQPEHRQQIDPKFKRKIEAIVRKPSKTEEQEPSSECPHCRFLVPLTELDCPHCKNSLPYCIVTGRHMVADDWSSCPYCRFPALFSELTAFVDADNEFPCPMCDKKISPDMVKKVEDPTPFLRNDTETKAEDEQNSGGAAGAGGR